MANIIIKAPDPAKSARIKPMNAVNNGPIRASEVEQTRGNFDEYKAARIPFARNHDASFRSEYGGEHTVDINAVFPDFSKDPLDPASYDFVLTDDYLKSIVDAGTEVFYRLGSKIEHWRKKYGTIVPPDFNKWAVVCEHIIRHYNEGWANGFRHNIRYWEIWNEPDGVKANGDQPNWSGTPEQFYELYRIAATRLKTCFPALKIGGPAVSYLYNDGGRWLDRFLASLTSDGKRVPMDFLGWHIYASDPRDITVHAEYARKKLDEAGYPDAESILDEYNYLENFTDKFIESIEDIIGMHGAAFTAAAMAVGQRSDVDMMMYYDASPSAFNGMFDFYTLRPLKGYYPFLMFSELYALGGSAESESDDPDIYAAAAISDDRKRYAVMLTNYRKDKAAGETELRVRLAGVSDGVQRGFLLDKSRTMEETDIRFRGGEARLTLPTDGVLLLRIVM